MRANTDDDSVELGAGARTTVLLREAKIGEKQRTRGENRLGERWSRGNEERITQKMDMAQKWHWGVLHDEAADALHKSRRRLTKIHGKIRVL
jgi:hypothetical protein